MPAAKPRNPRTGKPYTPAEDAAYDRSHKIAEGSKRDNALDKKRGVPLKKGKR